MHAECKRSVAAGRALINDQSERLMQAVRARTQTLLDALAVQEKQRLSEYEDRRVTVAVAQSQCQVLKVLCSFGLLRLRPIALPVRRWC